MKAFIAGATTEKCGGWSVLLLDGDIINDTTVMLTGGTINGTLMQMYYMALFELLRYMKHHEYTLQVSGIHVTNDQFKQLTRTPQKDVDVEYKVGFINDRIASVFPHGGLPAITVTDNWMTGYTDGVAMSLAMKYATAGKATYDQLSVGDTIGQRYMGAWKRTYQVFSKMIVTETMILKPLFERPGSNQYEIMTAQELEIANYFKF